ncbi:MAG: alpha-ketoacid dehydrogenase subunit beta [Deltaproteobacteria bacterium]|nr:alpha-ketoacid dehydrogenase subunit beta [Deltaproteobacteria bacterium]
MAQMNMSLAIRSAMELEMERDATVFQIGEDIGLSGGVFGTTAGLYAKFGDKRVMDTPISESGFMGAATGAAALGLRPVVSLMFVDFVGVCLDQILNQAAKMRYMFGGKAKIPMVVRANFGAGLGAGAQHSQSLEAFFMHIPGLKVVMPSTPYDAKGLLIAAIRDDNPVIFLEHKLLYGRQGEVPEESYTIPIGSADIKRPGTDVTVVATGLMVHQALSEAEKAEADGISVEVLDPRSLLPLDETAILESVKKTHRLIVVHEAVKFAGCGAEIAAMVAEKAFDYLDAPIMRLGAPFCPVPFSPVLEAAYLPGEADISAALRAITQR